MSAGALSSSGARFRPARVGGSVHAQVENAADGTIRLRSSEPLGAYPARLTDRLEQFAAEAPDRLFVARRGADGGWIRISYAQMLDRVRRIGQALAARPLAAERPVVILSDNDLEHLSLALAAQWVGVPYAPVSPAYSTVSQDFGKLRHIISTLNPGLVFASDGAAYGRAIAACAPADAEIVLTNGAASGRPATAFADLLATEPGAAEAQAHAAVGPDTIAKFLFTSGSTKQPKGVINTQRMLCANQQQIRQCFAFLADEPPVLVDWLPWNHTFGGNHNVGIALYNGGSFYIDEGKPTPKGMAATLANLREIAPTMYFNVPKGFEEIARAMEGDPALRARLFSRVKSFMYAGAGLSQAVWDQLERHGVAAVGERIRMFTGLGMTETAPSCTFAVGDGIKSGHIGLPVPGVEVKLVPMAGKLEIRFRGPNVMPGYWRAPEETAAAFDEEGFYRTGDAVLPVDPADPGRGLMFDGRIAEDFKLATGTFVSVGPMRAKVTLEGDPLVQDVVVAGINRDDIGLMIFPRLDDARRRFGLDAGLGAAEVLAEPRVRAFFQDLLDRLWSQGTGSATRPARAVLLAEPPSIDRGEVTDKGSINPRAVLSHRAALVERMYADPPASEVLVPRRNP
ncbi:MAG: feruloyl-CoA synthase [Burkholderiales bacterium]|nr:feruloyl-CoA synthase [Burkholderiales bacterium]